VGLSLSPPLSQLSLSVSLSLSLSHVLQGAAEHGAQGDAVDPLPDGAGAAGEQGAPRPPSTRIRVCNTWFSVKIDEGDQIMVRRGPSLRASVRRNPLGCAVEHVPGCPNLCPNLRPNLCPNVCPNVCPNLRPDQWPPIYAYSCGEIVEDSPWSVCSGACAGPGSAGTEPLSQICQMPGLHRAENPAGQSFKFSREGFQRRAGTPALSS
jgi:hypothetical protein